MWAAIASNRRRSFILIVTMALLLLALGFSLGYFIDPITGPIWGPAAALIIWLVMWLIAILEGDSIVLANTGARELQKEDAPQLWNVVEEMTISAGLPNMPRVYLIEDDAPNAFAVGRNPESAAVAVTSGLLERLDRDELQGVIAHEIGHVKNLDIRFMTLAAVMVGSIVLVSDYFWRFIRYGGGRRRSAAGDADSPKGLMIMVVISLMLVILAPIAARLLYLACSRRREFLADASAARYTRYPAGLASALEKIATHRRPLSAEVNRAVAPLYIINPLEGLSAASWFCTHPPAEVRIKILRSMAGGAGFADYESAYRRVTGMARNCLPPRLVAARESVSVRAPSPHDPAAQNHPSRVRDVQYLLERMGKYRVVPCACGVEIKVPPTYDGDVVRCPRCGTAHDIREDKKLNVTDDSGAPLVYHRKGKGWERFKCGCGSEIELSPTFAAKHVECKRCSRVYEVE